MTIVQNKVGLLWKQRCTTARGELLSELKGEILSAIIPISLYDWGAVAITIVHGYIIFMNDLCNKMTWRFTDLGSVTTDVLFVVVVWMTTILSLLLVLVLLLLLMGDFVVPATRCSCCLMRSADAVDGSMSLEPLGDTLTTDDESEQLGTTRNAQTT